MNSPARSEVNAAIEALEGRVERRIDSLERKVDRLIERTAPFDEKLNRVEADCRETRAIAMSLKSTIVTTSVASAIAIIIGFSALSSAMHNNMLSAFSSGKENAALQAQIKSDQAQIQKNQAQIERAFDEFAKQRAAMEETWRRHDAELNALRRQRNQQP